MKLSKREKLLLFVLSLVIVAGGWARFIALPIINQIQDNKAMIVELETKKAEMQIEVAAYKDIEEKIEQEKQVAMADGFFEREASVVFVDELTQRLARQCGVRIKDCSVSTIQPTVIEGYGASKYVVNYPLRDLRAGFDEDELAIIDEETNEAIRNTSPEVDNKAVWSTAARASCNLTIEGSFETIMKFIDAVKKEDKSFYVDNFQIAEESEGTVVGLNFYFIR